MTIDELASVIHSTNCAMIEVERTILKTGNADGSGNYNVLTLRMGEEVIEFNNSTGVWTAKRGGSWFAPA